MKKVAVITDSNSGITQEKAKKLGITVLPMPFFINDELYYEDITLSQEEFYRFLAQNADVKTSQPTPEAVLNLWDKALEAYDEVVYIPMSSGLSNACFNAEQLAKDYEGKVQVVDNHRISLTQEASAISACKLAQQEKSAAQIKAYLEERAYDASIYITVDSMEYLRKGGRVTPAAATFATVLNLKPVLTIQGDKLDTYAKARGMQQAELKMLEAVKKDRTTRFADVPDEELRVETAGTFENADKAKRWRKMVQAEFPTIKVSYVDLPCSIACHLGINAAGTGILKKEVV